MFGVEIWGLDPCTPLDPETLAQLRTLFDQKGVLIFREIDVDIEFQTYLSEVLIGNDIAPSDLQLNDKFLISNKEPQAAAPRGRLLYHCDQMWSEHDRVDIISLYGQEVGQPATPTMFVSAEYTWRTLPGDLRDRVEGCRAVQHYTPETYAKRAKGGHGCSCVHI
ncbi:Taurine catabolism dioxygenase TauD, TfdA family [Novosphingobium sp. CF614]|nr:Taurine catabolism dioxygenase TauD, TfdA family [Novosphingobium sp. CF614]